MTETIERNATPSAVAQQPRLLDQVRAAIRTRHYSLRTEQAYCHWIKRYILFHGKRHPLDMGAPEIEAFLSALATDRGVSASTQNQALAAILFLYREAGAVVALCAGVAGCAQIVAIRTICAGQCKRVCTIHQPG